MFLFAQISIHLSIFMYNYYAITIFPTMDFTHSQTMSKPSKINLLIPFTSLFNENFHSLQLIVFTKWRFSKALNTDLYIKQKKIK
jgi:hypothetical protein